MRWAAAWQAAQPWDGTFEDWVRAHLARHCDYWHPCDIVDRVADGLEPRHVSVLNAPAAAQHSTGGVYVDAAAMEPGFRVEDVGYLVPTLQTAINHKHQHGQMSGAAADKYRQPHRFLVDCTRRTGGRLPSTVPGPLAGPDLRAAAVRLRGLRKGPQRGRCRQRGQHRSRRQHPAQSQHWAKCPSSTSASLLIVASKYSLPRPLAAEHAGV